jgi:phage baseplate assembly protein gpV
MSTFISDISSRDLVIPLDPSPELKEGKTIYKYRDGARFTNIFDILSELLGLSAPLVVKDVMLSSSEITIATREEFEAKQKFVSSLNEIQKTLQIKKKP